MNDDSDNEGFYVQTVTAPHTMNFKHEENLITERSSSSIRRLMNPAKGDKILHGQTESLVLRKDKVTKEFLIDGHSLTH